MPKKIQPITEDERKDILSVHRSLGTPIKRCGSCHREWPRTAEFFKPDAQYKDGYKICRQCHRNNSIKNAHKRHKRNRERFATEGPLYDATRLKKCSACKQKFPATSEFYMTWAQEKDGLATRCRRCSAKMYTKWYNEKYANDLSWADKKRAYSLQYAKNNPDKHAAHSNRRRALKLQATPSWADDAAIQQIYTAAVNSKMHVDHVFPLKGTWGTGLHHELNLFILDGSENLRKHNSWPWQIDSPPPKSCRWPYYPVVELRIIVAQLPAHTVLAKVA